MDRRNRVSGVLLAGLLPLVLAACTPTAERPAPPPPKPHPTAAEEYSISKHPICFASGSDKIEQSADPELIDMAVWLKQHAKVSIAIDGHTDDRGTREYNLALGQARAEAMRQALMKLGIARTRMTAIGYGMERPLVAEPDDEAQRDNRCAVAVIDTDNP